MSRVYPDVETQLLKIETYTLWKR